ncbi:MAG: hypothetical protein KC457_31900, partial [Myxococcales bacterium]|nr:hypothetical protein [Myxococcales bacterium]
GLAVGDDGRLWMISQEARDGDYTALLSELDGDSGSALMQIDLRERGLGPISIRLREKSLAAGPGSRLAWAGLQVGARGHLLALDADGQVDCLLSFDDRPLLQPLYAGDGAIYAAGIDLTDTDRATLIRVR